MRFYKKICLTWKIYFICLVFELFSLSWCFDTSRTIPAKTFPDITKDGYLLQKFMTIISYRKWPFSQHRLYVCTYRFLVWFLKNDEKPPNSTVRFLLVGVLSKYIIQHPFHHRLISPLSGFTRVNEHEMNNYYDPHKKKVWFSLQVWENSGYRPFQTLWHRQNRIEISGRFSHPSEKLDGNLERFFQIYREILA